MKAAVLHKVHDPMTIEDFDMPKISADEVLIGADAYTAASLAKTDPMKTGWECMRLGVLAYIVPFIFALLPSLLLIGPWESVAPTVTTALIATVLLGIGLVGYLFRPIGAFRRSFHSRRSWSIYSGGPVGAICHVDVGN